MMQRIDGAIATLTLACPSRRNALSVARIRALTDALAGLAMRPEIRVVVIDAEGDDFCSGADLRDPEWMQLLALPLHERRLAFRLGDHLIAAVRNLPQVTVAAIHGACLGGGACIALACDLRVTGPVQLGFPEARRGLNMGWGMISVLREQVSMGRLKELLLADRMLDRDTLLAWGLAQRGADSADCARDEARAWAETIAHTIAPVAAAMIKEGLHQRSVFDADQQLLALQSEHAVAAMALMWGAP